MYLTSFLFRKGTLHIRLPFLFCIVGVFFLCAWGQNFPNVVYETPEIVGPGTTWQQASNANPLWKFHIFKIELSNRAVQLVPAHQERTTAFVRTSALAVANDAIAATNGSFFGLAETSEYFGQSTYYCLIDGELLSPNRGGTRPVFGIRHDGTMLETRIESGWDGQPNPPNPNWTDILHALGGNPVLVRNGAVIDGLDNETRHPRTMLGWSDSTQTVWLVTVDGRQPSWSVGMTSSEQARFMVDLGCEHAINYDGGGSTTAWVNGQVVNSGSDGHERGTVTAWLVIPAYVIDHTDTECIKTGNWQISIEPGLFNTSSLIADGGEEATITWRPDLEMEGQYKVYAWYTSGADRPSSVEYTVHDFSGTQTVNVNQQTGGGEWEMLGNFVFLSGAKGYVQLENNAVPGEVLSADAMKFVWTGPGFAEYIIDNMDSANTSMTGSWSTGEWPTPWGPNYYWTSAGDGSLTFSFFKDMPVKGIYEVYSWWVQGTNRATNARYRIHHPEGIDTLYVNQQQNGSAWNLLGTYFYEEGDEGRVVIDNSGNGVVMADAVKFNLIEIHEERTFMKNWELYSY